MQPSPRPTLEHEQLTSVPVIQFANGDETSEARMNTSHGNDNLMNVSQTHANVAGRPNTSDSSAGLARMEAAQRSEIAGQEFMQSVHGELLLPLLHATRPLRDDSTGATLNVLWHRL